MLSQHLGRQRWADLYGFEAFHLAMQISPWWLDYRTYHRSPLRTSVTRVQGKEKLTELDLLGVRGTQRLRVEFLVGCGRCNIPSLLQQGE